MQQRHRNRIRRKVMLVDKQGELRIKLAPMHPNLLFTQQSGLIIAVWLFFLVFVAVYTGILKA